MSNWGDDIRQLSVHNNQPSKMEIEVAQSIFGNSRNSFLDNPHLKVALVASLLYIFLNLNIVNSALNKITKNEMISKVILTVILFLSIYGTSYYQNEL